MEKTTIEKIDNIDNSLSFYSFIKDGINFYSMEKINDKDIDVFLLSKSNKKIYKLERKEGKLFEGTLKKTTNKIFNKIFENDNIVKKSEIYMLMKGKKVIDVFSILNGEKLLLPKGGLEKFCKENELEHVEYIKHNIDEFFNIYRNSKKTIMIYNKNNLIIPLKLDELNIIELSAKDLLLIYNYIGKIMYHILYNDTYFKDVCIKTKDNLSDFEYEIRKLLKEYELHGENERLINQIIDNEVMFQVFEARIIALSQENISINKEIDEEINEAD